MSTLEGRRRIAAAMMQPIRCGGKDYLPPPPCGTCGRPGGRGADLGCLECICQDVTDR